MTNWHVGQKFSSFSEFERYLSCYERKSLVKFSKRDSRKIESAVRTRKVNIKLNPNLIYYEVKYTCFRGGAFREQGTGKRKRSSCKINCSAHISLRATADGKSLEVKSFSDTHNHEVLKLGKMCGLKTAPSTMDFPCLQTEKICRLKTAPSTMDFPCLQTEKNCRLKTSVSTMAFPSPSVLKQAFHNHFKVPIIFKNSLKSWKSVPWTLEELLEHYGNVGLNFRLVLKADKNISWEKDAVYVEATISDFIEWQNVESSNLQHSNPFYNFEAEEYWAYSSYNYMSQIFKDSDDILKAVDWSIFGYPETPLEDSAFWIGSEGACTPCHYDTYGFNFVAQIQGRKQWTLFPPGDTPFMYPTRIPYEESSVYSSVNISNPDLKTHPLFKFSHPHVLTLEPGDVLFVPNKWWHFVQSTDVSVTINTWLKLDSDKNTRLEEGISRAIMSSYISYFEPVGESWLNVGEEVVSPEVAISYISTVLSETKSTDSKSGSQNEGDSSSSSKKISKTDFDSDVHSKDSKKDSKTFTHEDIEYAVPVAFSDWFDNDIDSEPAVSSKDIKLKDIIDCFVHPNVISEICKLLKKV